MLHYVHHLVATFVRLSFGAEQVVFSIDLCLCWAYVSVTAAFNSLDSSVGSFTLEMKIRLTSKLNAGLTSTFNIGQMRKFFRKLKTDWRKNPTWPWLMSTQCWVLTSTWFPFPAIIQCWSVFRVQRDISTVAQTAQVETVFVHRPVLSGPIWQWCWQQQAEVVNAASSTQICLWHLVGLSELVGWKQLLDAAGNRVVESGETKPHGRYAEESEQQAKRG